MSEGDFRPSDTRCEMTNIVMPGQANALGTAFGGQIMAWIDVCAAVSAQRFARGSVVTAAMDTLVFEAPIRQGDVVVLQGQVNWAGRTSMEVGVRVEAEDRASGLRTKAAAAYLTFVAVDDAGRPRPVPKLLPQTDVEKRRSEAAVARRAARLALRDALQHKPAPA